MKELLCSLTPVIELDKLQDNFSNQSQDYSFVTEPANNLSSNYFELSSRACLNLECGLMTKGDWKARSVKRFLRQEERLLDLIMLLMFLRGGQAPRAPELLGIECSNGVGTSRGIYVHGGAIVYVTRHAKARRTTNQEFQVARYLPLADSALLAIYLVYIRPFAEMLSYSCFSIERKRSLLFASAVEPGKPWKVARLTRALKALSKEVCAHELGVQIYRQLSIAVTERHVTAIRKPFNRFDDRTVQADLEVAFAWQSGHRPLQRGTTYGVDGAFPDSLQPALLRIYKWASTQWHEFLSERTEPFSAADMEISTPISACTWRESMQKRRLPDAPTPHPKRRHSAGDGARSRNIRQGMIDFEHFWSSSEKKRKTNHAELPGPTGY